MVIGDEAPHPFLSLLMLIADGSTSEADHVSGYRCDEVVEDDGDHDKKAPLGKQ